jgi:hypothetical protein
VTLALRPSAAANVTTTCGRPTVLSARRPAAFSFTVSVRLPAVTAFVTAPRRFAPLTTSTVAVPAVREGLREPHARADLPGAAGGEAQGLRGRVLARALDDLLDDLSTTTGFSTTTGLSTTTGSGLRSGSTSVTSAVRVAPPVSGTVTLSFCSPKTGGSAGTVSVTGTARVPVWSKSCGGTVAVAPGIVVVATGSSVPLEAPLPTYASWTGIVTVEPGRTATGTPGPETARSRSGTVGVRFAPTIVFCGPSQPLSQLTGAAAAASSATARVVIQVAETNCSTSGAPLAPGASNLAVIVAALAAGAVSRPVA